jgi:hypothetical protein
VAKSAVGKGAQAIDRWATLNLFARNDLAELTAETGSTSAGVVWFVLFSLADGRTGLVRGASLSGLARMTALDRNTVRRAVRKLLDRGALSVHDRAGGVPVYYLNHLTKAAGDDD